MTGNKSDCFALAFCVKKGFLLKLDDILVTKVINGITIDIPKSPGSISCLQQ